MRLTFPSLFLLGTVTFSGATLNGHSGGASPESTPSFASMSGAAMRLPPVFGDNMALGDVGLKIALWLRKGSKFRPPAPEECTHQRVAFGVRVAGTRRAQSA